MSKLFNNGELDLNILFKRFIWNKNYIAIVFLSTLFLTVFTSKQKDNINRASIVLSLNPLAEIYYNNTSFILNNKDFNSIQGKNYLLQTLRKELLDKKNFDMWINKNSKSKKLNALDNQNLNFYKAETNIIRDKKKYKGNSLIFNLDTGLNKKDLFESLNSYTSFLEQKIIDNHYQDSKNIIKDLKNDKTSLVNSILLETFIINNKFVELVDDKKYSLYTLDLTYKIANKYQNLSQVIAYMILINVSLILPLILFNYERSKKN